MANQDEDLARLETLLGALGQPLHVFRNYPFWKPLVTDPDRPAGRSGGTGLNSLHLDCANAARPPDYVCLYCVRPDPLGGGSTLVASLDALAKQLTDDTLTALQRPMFRDGKFYDLDHVGADVSPFPVFSETGWRWRYTGRLLETGAVPSGSVEHTALLECDRILMSRAIILSLKAGDALIVDQRRMVHGRLSLGSGQTSVPADLRRLLVQAYCKDVTDG